MMELLLRDEKGSIYFPHLFGQPTHYTHKVFNVKFNLLFDSQKFLTYVWIHVILMCLTSTTTNLYSLDELHS